MTPQPPVEKLWHLNEHGLWCPACGNLIAAPWNMDDDYQPPESCKQCGFPDFEDGPGYFTDDENQERGGRVDDRVSITVLQTAASREADREVAELFTV